MQFSGIIFARFFMIIVFYREIISTAGKRIAHTQHDPNTRLSEARGDDRPVTSGGTTHVSGTGGRDDGRRPFGLGGLPYPFRRITPTNDARFTTTTTTATTTTTNTAESRGFKWLQVGTRSSTGKRSPGNTRNRGGGGGVFDKKRLSYVWPGLWQDKPVPSGNGGRYSPTRPGVSMTATTDGSSRKPNGRRNTLASGHDFDGYPAPRSRSRPPVQEATVGGKSKAFWRTGFRRPNGRYAKNNRRRDNFWNFGGYQTIGKIRTDAVHTIASTDDDDDNEGDEITSLPEAPVTKQQTTKETTTSSPDTITTTTSTETTTTTTTETTTTTTTETTTPTNTVASSDKKDITTQKWYDRIRRPFGGPASLRKRKRRLNGVHGAKKLCKIAKVHGKSFRKHTSKGRVTRVSGHATTRQPVFGKRRNQFVKDPQRFTSVATQDSEVRLLWIWQKRGVASCRPTEFDALKQTV